MQTEEQCNPSQRFLFADTYFSDQVTSLWKTECVKRCKDKEKGEAYERYMNWVRRKNEVAVFTLYAYADFDVPKRFDIIFRLNDPQEFLQMNYELAQSILEAWFPLDALSHGHKHLCVFSFDKEVPVILNELHKEENKFSTSPKRQKSLAPCC